MTMAEEMIIGGFVSKIVSDVVDIPANPIKDAIRNADKKRKEKNQSIETRIYQVTIDAIKEFTKREYKGQDVLYDAAESIIRGFKNSNSSVEIVRAGLKMLGLQVTSETCEEFLKTLYHEICMDENDILYKEIILNQGGQIFETMREGFSESSRNHEETHRKLDYAIEGIDNINEKISRAENGETKHYEIPIKNRAGEYADKWEKNVFLNNFNEEDENAGVNIKLSEIYTEECLPHYVWGFNTQSSDRLKNYLMKYINSDKKKMLLILGQPGIGKSTLITWIMANLVEEEENILVYQFASDLKSVNWQDDNILDEIFATIDLGYNMLEGKTLILDGFDEISVKENRERILLKLNQELEKKNYLRKFSLVLTCRENYVDKIELKGIEYITLQAWDETQIRSFCENYEKMIVGKDLARDNRNLEMKIGKIMEKKDIMGIPLILYMVLALNVDVEKSSSTVDIFDQVFSLKKGGIYDRGYDIEHRINAPEIKRHIHHISQRIAFWIFENNSNEATISQEKFEEICDHEMQESEQKDDSIQRDILIGNFFKLKHCEGKETDEIQFVHRSIYEYFVVLYFFESVCSATSKEEVAGKLGELLKDGHLSKQILEFVRYKFSSMKGCDLSNITREVFNIMLRHGMTYYFIKEQKVPLLNIIDREMRIFSNMLEIVHLWNLSLEKTDNKIVSYLRFNRGNCLNLSGVDLSGANLSGVDLGEADLSEANLSEANLREADLREANLMDADLADANLRRAYLSEAYLSGANLSGADLNGAYLNETDLSEANLIEADLSDTDLSEANLSGANLIEADLSGADLGEADLSGANLYETKFDENQVELLCHEYHLTNSKVYISETRKTITYKEYYHKSRV